MFGLLCQKWEQEEGEESAALGEIRVVLLETYLEYTTFNSKRILRHMFWQKQPWHNLRLTP